MSGLRTAGLPFLPAKIGRLPIVTCLCLAMLVLTPALTYWRTVVHEYGFRDDYSRLREVREEPGKTVELMAADSRPIGGFLLERSLESVYDVTDLPWLRLVGVLFLTATGLALWALLRRSGWPDPEAAAVGVGVTLLPGAQVVAAWAIAWPIALTLLLAIAGCAAVEAWVSRGAPRGVLACGCLCYLIAGLTYQSSALFAVVPLAAMLLVRPPDSAPTVKTWTTVHLAVLVGCLALDYFLMHLLFALGVFQASDRLQLEPDVIDKLLWFVTQPLTNALGLFALRDSFATSPAFWGTALTVTGVIVLGWRVERRNDVARGRRWALALFVLPFVGHSVSLAAAERAIGYRTLIALSGLALVLLIFAMRTLAAAWRLRAATRHAALIALVLVAAALADYNSFALIAVPQGHEWTIVRDAAEHLVPTKSTEVYVVTPTLDDRSTRAEFADEFGSLSADSDWAPQEMFKAALRHRFPSGLPAGDDVTITVGRFAPSPSLHDLVVDMRRLRRLRPG